LASFCFAAQYRVAFVEQSSSACFHQSWLMIPGMYDYMLPHLAILYLVPIWKIFGDAEAPSARP
jgi:hypothetical protein